jgi:amino acid transporter
MRKNKLSRMAVFGITVAFFGAVRAIPTVASSGWEQIIYMIMSGFLFALPVALISAELSTMWTDEGGSQVWITHGINKAWGFVAPWMLWIMMFFGMVMVSSTFSTTLGVIINNSSMQSNNAIVFAVIVGTYWLITFLNLKFDMLKVSGGWGTVVGVYIPFAIIIALGVAYFAKNGVSNAGYLADFTPDKLVPNFADTGTIAVFVAIMFIFSGIEMSTVHVNEMKNPRKDYPAAVIMAVLVVVILNLVAGLGMADAVPSGKMELSNLMYSVEIMVNDLGLPSILTNIIGIFAMVGIFTMVSTWVLGPSKQLSQVARKGALPKFFQKLDKKGDPVNIILLQAVAITVISSMYLIPGVDINSMYLMFTVTTTLLYAFVYVLIGISAIRLRYKQPDTPRIFRLGKKGNAMMWVVAMITIVMNMIIIASSMMPEAGLTPAQSVGYVVLQVAAVCAAVITGLLIYKFRKPQWAPTQPDGEGADAQPKAPDTEEKQA